MKWIFIKTQKNWWIGEVCKGLKRFIRGSLIWIERRAKGS